MPTITREVTGNHKTANTRRINRDRFTDGAARRGRTEMDKDPLILKLCERIDLMRSILAALAETGNKAETWDRMDRTINEIHLVHNGEIAILEQERFQPDLDD